MNDDKEYSYPLCKQICTNVDGTAKLVEKGATTARSVKNRGTRWFKVTVSLGVLILFAIAIFCVVEHLEKANKLANVEDSLSEQERSNRDRFSRLNSTIKELPGRWTMNLIVGYIESIINGIRNETNTAYSSLMQNVTQLNSKVQNLSNQVKSFDDRSTQDNFNWSLQREIDGLKDKVFGVVFAFDVTYLLNTVTKSPWNFRPQSAFTLIQETIIDGVPITAYLSLNSWFGPKFYLHVFCFNENKKVPFKCPLDRYIRFAVLTNKNNEFMNGKQLLEEKTTQVYSWYLTYHTIGKAPELRENSVLDSDNTIRIKLKVLD